jgi:hypothetical protein
MEHIKQSIYPPIALILPPSNSRVPSVRLPRSVSCYWLRSAIPVPPRTAPAISFTCKPNSLRRYAKPGVTPCPNASKGRWVGELGYPLVGSVGLGLMDKSPFLVTPPPFADRDHSKLHSTPHLQKPYLVT